MWSVRRVAETASTNADVSALARNGAAEGVAVVVDHQTAGRGRLDRTWQTPPGTSLTASFLLRPDDVPAARWPWLPLLVGVAVADTVQHLTAVAAVLKWPNDVLVGERKLAGILVERVETPTGAAAVAGVGVNLTQRLDQLPDGATSLFRECTLDAVPSRDDVLSELCVRLAGRYVAWRSAGGDPDAGLAQAYRHRCGTLGREVRVELPGRRTVEGTAVGIDDFGRIVVRTPAAADPVVVGAGDAVHLRPA